MIRPYILADNKLLITPISIWLSSTIKVYPQFLHCPEGQHSYSQSNPSLANFASASKRLTKFHTPIIKNKTQTAVIYNYKKPSLLKKMTFRIMKLNNDFTTEKPIILNPLLKATTHQSFTRHIFGCRLRYMHFDGIPPKENWDSKQTWDCFLDATLPHVFPFALNPVLLVTLKL